MFLQTTRIRDKKSFFSLSVAFFKMIGWLKQLRVVSPAVAFLLVSFSLGELGDGLNIFQGIYLVGLGWNEGAVGTALSIVSIAVIVLSLVFRFPSHIFTYSVGD